MAEIIPIQIGITRRGLTTQTDLSNIRAALHGNNTAIKHISDFLRYANTVLSSAESYRRTPYCQVRAQVHYGNMMFELLPDTNPYRAMRQNTHTNDGQRVETIETAVKRLVCQSDTVEVSNRYLPRLLQMAARHEITIASQPTKKGYTTVSAFPKPL